MNLWEIEFKEHWDYMGKNDFDDCSKWNVVAGSFSGAVEKARILALSQSIEAEDEEGKFYHCAEVQIVKAERGIEIDAV